jgi:hypothetical protein
MEIIMIILHLANGEVAKIPAKLALGEFCSDKVEEITRFVENPNYEDGNGQVWVHRYYKDKIVFATHCESPDGKYLINYNAGKECTKK